jgi:uncharacterized protein YdeI (YjbR/CyaY-like superfamily)
VLETQPREVAVPADFDAALSREAAARDRFDALSAGHRRWWVETIEGAEEPVTRRRRIQKAVAALAH